tara:strand:+ start:825 stop:1769 length:945 start_codon:yes stop_codon:yes gene_type:complete
MGADQSHDASCPIETEDNNTNRKQYFYDKYNWVPSLPGFEFDTLNMDKLRRKFDCEQELTGYIDLRTSFPQIQSLDKLPFNPIISVVYLLHYQLLKNKLPIFPPSAMYIYKNINYYKNIASLFSFEIIFNSILNNGFCSENEFPTNTSNLNSAVNNKVIEKACAFKFIDIYKVEQKLEVIQRLLANDYPVLVGMSVYYDLSNVDAYMWVPDEKIDTKLGGITFVLVGYITERNMFIAATTFGKYFGTNGFILIPFDYILNEKYTGELYTLDFKKERVEGYINQRKEMVNLQNNREIQQENKKQYQEDSFGGLFR